MEFSNIFKTILRYYVVFALFDIIQFLLAPLVAGNTPQHTTAPDPAGGRSCDSD